MNKIIIINTGNGNFLSVKRAVELFYKNVEISDKADEIKSAAKIILPGVGAFKDSVNILKKKKIFDTIKEVSKDTPLLGICLGMQLLFKNSNEFGLSEGLNLINGEIRPLALEENNDLALKVPNIGWYSLNSNSKNSKFFNKELDEFYFIHSFYAKNVKADNLIASYTFGNLKVPAIVKDKTIIGCQFHPEKSRGAGLNIIKKFLNDEI